MHQLVLLVVLVAVSALFGQTANTVTAAASVTRPATAGSAVFQVQFLDTNLAANVDGALAVLGASGATAENLVSVSAQISQGFLVTAHTFAISVPVGEYGATRDKLITAQRALANSSTQGLSWSVSYTPNAEDTARYLRETMAVLLARAKANADALAEGMGKSTDALVTLTAPAVSVSGLQITVTVNATYSVK